MDPATCPQDYTCSFTLVHPRTVYHTVGPWYQHTAGWIVAIVAILVLGALLAYAIASFVDLKAGRDKARQLEREAREEREHKLAMAEQRTMQIDSAKGNPEMLKMIKEMGR